MTARDLADLAERAKAVVFTPDVGAVMLGLSRVVENETAEGVVERRASGLALVVICVKIDECALMALDFVLKAMEFVHVLQMMEF